MLSRLFPLGIKVCPFARLPEPARRQDQPDVIFVSSPSFRRRPIRRSTANMRLPARSDLLAERKNPWIRRD